ncbi:HTH_48 domain-containing protein [Trichonephila clavipes]|nr:HTH_48 domain-containing protein [Trichonephila clavipes]
MVYMWCRPLLPSHIPNSYAHAYEPSQYFGCLPVVKRTTTLKQRRCHIGMPRSKTITPRVFQVTSLQLYCVVFISVCDHSKCLRRLAIPPTVKEVHFVIRFLNARNVKPVEIPLQVAEIYGENLVSDEMMRKWVRQFNDFRTNVPPRRGSPSVVDGRFAERMNEKIRENK